MSNKKIYFIGIGGIGMSALARWYRAMDYDVAGYDKTSTPLTVDLQNEGIDIHFSDDVKNIPIGFSAKNTLVVFTPAVSKDHSELIFFVNNGNRVIKRAEALGDLTKKTFTIAVAGTHGKTTTSSMIAHVLKEAGINCFAFIGGITQNYNSNLLFGDFTKSEKVMVVEADEYDRSFHRLFPSVAVITAMDPDHLDIYKDEKDFQNSFSKFVDNISESGSLIYKSGLNIAAPKPTQNFKSFGLENCDYKAIITDESNFVFTIETTSEVIKNIQLGTPGFHNIQNALAAFGVARYMGIPAEEIKKSLQTFRGVKRRFDFIVRNNKIIYIDDYAHHPTEITSFLSSVKAMFPGKKITAIFQPHLFSRTRDFMDGFAESLSIADKIILLEIYPARELPIDGINSEKLLKLVTAKEKILLQKENLIDYLKKNDDELLVTLGAGDVDQFIMPIKNLLIDKFSI